MGKQNYLFNQLLCSLVVPMRISTMMILIDTIIRYNFVENRFKIVRLSNYLLYSIRTEKYKQCSFTYLVYKQANCCNWRER